MIVNYQAIIGLGNPGKKYVFTRHNVGYLAIDELCQRMRVQKKVRSKTYELNELKVKGHRVDAVKPLTFMNTSGESVIRYINNMKIPIDRIVIVHDDLDLDPGRIKIKVGGGTGGHNGLKSVIQHTGSDAFTRVRIGIGHPVLEESSVNYVLTEPSEDKDRISDGIKLAVLAIKTLLFEGAIPAMNRYNYFNPKTVSENGV